MNNQMVFMQDNMVATSSRVVAEYFGKRHDDVLKAIDNKKGTTQNCGLLDSMFFESTYTTSQNKQAREVIMNRDGFSLLAMGFTGAKALEFQLKFIQEFNRMEAELKAVSVPSYQIEDEIERAIRWAEERREERNKRLVLETTIVEQQPLVELAIKRLSKEGCMSITDVTKTFGLKRGALTNHAKELGMLHKKNIEVNQCGDDYFKVYDNNGFKAIGVTEVGVRWVQELINTEVL